MNIRADLTILVTGATGFVGANVVQCLAQHGHDVIACDLNEPDSLLRDFWHGAEGGISYEKGDVLNLEWLADVCTKYGPNAFVHAAAVTAVDIQSELRATRAMIATNILGTVNVLEAARNYSGSRVVVLSSSGIYGTSRPDVVLQECRHLQLEDFNTYLITKEVSERIGLRYVAVAGEDVVIGRVNGPYGPMERPNNVRHIMSPIFQIVRAALERGSVRIGGPFGPFSLTYTADLADSIRLLLETTELAHRTYNLSSGVVHSTGEVLDALGRLMTESQFELVMGESEVDVALSTLSLRGRVDIERLQTDTGFRPAYDLATGLQSAMPWWRASLGT